MNISCLSLFRYERAAKRKKFGKAVAAPSDSNTQVGYPTSSSASPPSPNVDFVEEKIEKDIAMQKNDIALQKNDIALQKNDIALQKNAETQTDMTSGYIGQLEQEVNNLTQENMKLRCEIKKKVRRTKSSSKLN